MNKQRGRPRLYSGGRRATTVRFTPERYRDLAAAAEAAGRSISEKIEYRIERLAHYLEAPTLPGGDHARVRFDETRKKLRAYEQ